MVSTNASKDKLSVELTDDLSERAGFLLQVLVECYLVDGQPVASKRLAQASHLKISAATVRHVMADLETQQYISSPHTSAGRVPTIKGLRYFLDNLVRLETGVSYQSQLLPPLEVTQPSATLFNQTSNFLAGMTNLVGVVSTPTTTNCILNQIEFVPLTSQRVLVILVFNNTEVQNRIIETTRPFQRSQLEQIANYLTRTFAGLELKIIHNELIQRLRDERHKLGNVMDTIIQVAEQTFTSQSTKQADLVLSGQHHALAFTDKVDPIKISRLFEAFTEKQEILQLLTQCIEAEGIEIFIGDDNALDSLAGHSLVTKTYHKNGEVQGVLGVIGPTRMAYKQIIPIVSLAANSLTAALNRINNTPY